MTDLKLLLVEDNDDDKKVVESTIRRYEREHDRQIHVTMAVSEDDAQSKISNDFDAAIVDLKLGNDAEGGVKLIDKIRDQWRIPVAVVTGTPQAMDNTNGLLKVYKKGEADWMEVIHTLVEVCETGLTRIFGGRGVIEEEMTRVFWHAVLPSVASWVQHRRTGKDTERALLRYAVNHLIEFLGENSAHFAEEAYVTPAPPKADIPVSRQLRTGSIVSKRGEKGTPYYFVITPACDLVVHNGSIKTERVLVCAVQGLDCSLVTKANGQCNTPIPGGDAEAALKAQKERERGTDTLRRLCQNTYCPYMHFLPTVAGFPGGLINFRRLEAFAPRDFDKAFTLTSLQVAPFFVKDIVSRFASFYARQGQPDLDFEAITAALAQPAQPPEEAKR